MSLLPSAQESRIRTRDYPFLVQESSVIDAATISAVDQGALVAEIANSFMTTPNTLVAQNFYKSWKRLDTDSTLDDQMNTIIQHYTDRGYRITRVTNTQTMNTFNWVVRW